MKFVCSNCKAKYQIADEKTAGRTLRMTCRRCNNEIVIQGAGPAATGGSGGGTGARRDPRHERPAAPPPAASALAKDFRRQVASGGNEISTALVSDEWHVAINDIPVGPMRREEVARKIGIGAVSPDSLAWREGLDDWMPAADIPELAMLFGAQLQAPPPPAEVRPAARARVMPVGGRVGVEASPAAIENIAIPQPVGDPFERFSTPAPAAQTTPPPSSDGQNAGRMFLMVSAGVFVMFVGVVIGVKVLTPPQPAPAVIAAPTPASDVAPSNPRTPADEEDDTGNVVALELQEIDGTASSAAAKAKASADATKKAGATSASGRQLTAAEQALLDQMSGGGSTANIKTRTATSGQQEATGGDGLTAAQLSSVVNKKRSELQRCYESALRATASTDTVRLDVDITIGGSGVVTRVATRGKALTGMDTCIERTVKLWRFPAGGAETRTSFPVVFQPGA